MERSSVAHVARFVVASWDSRAWDSSPRPFRTVAGWRVSPAALLLSRLWLDSCNRADHVTRLALDPILLTWILTHTRGEAWAYGARVSGKVAGPVRGACAVVLPEGIDGVTRDVPT